MEDKLAATRCHMQFLLYWGLVNFFLSGVVLILKGRWRHFHEHNLLWNLVTLATYAGLKRYLLRGLYTGGREDAPTDPTNEELLQKARTALVFSLGLDLALYPYGGGLLNVLGKLRESERLRRYGVSMWIQGLIHLTSSLLWLHRLSASSPEDADPYRRNERTLRT